MYDEDATARRAQEVTVERWEYDNPSWIVIGLHSVITSAPDGAAHDEIEVQVQHRETGEILNGVGSDAVTALAMISHRLSERP
jgi:hypothetical protein